MRIAVVASEFPSISETFIVNQITSLIGLGHDVEIFAGRPKKEIRAHPDVEKYRLLEKCNYFPEPPEKNKLAAYIGALLSLFFRRPGLFFEALKAVKETSGAVPIGLIYKVCPFFGKKCFDVILCHFGPNGNTGTLLSEMGLGGKVVTFFHGYDMSNYLDKAGRGAYNYLFRKGDLFLPVSEKWKGLLKDLGCDESKTIVHRMGVDAEKFTFRGGNGAGGGKIKLLTIARLIEKKGVRYGIEAVAKLLPLYPDIEYAVAGDGPLKGELQALIDGFGCARRIKLLGWKDQDEILGLMREADILLAPSITGSNGAKEGIPVVLMEALAQGIPVVSTFHSGIPEIITDNKTGFLVTERDVDGLASKLESLLTDPELRARMGREGRAAVEADYDVKKLTRRLEAVLMALVSGQSPLTLIK